MTRLPLLLALLLALTTLAAAPALATAAAPAGAHLASDDGEDPGDAWDEEDPGDDWGDECADDDEACWMDEDPCGVGIGDGDWDDWSDEEALARVASDDEGWDDEACEEEVVPVTLSALRATPARRGAVRVSFRLDGEDRVALVFERVGAGASTRCGKGAKSAKAGRKPKACKQPAAVRGEVALDGVEGANETTLRRWKGRRLPPGSYRLTATAETSDGEPATTTFTLRVPARRS